MNSFLCFLCTESLATRDVKCISFQGTMYSTGQTFALKIKYFDPRKNVLWTCVEAYWAFTSEILLQFKLHLKDMVYAYS